jgi:hypothetical protein
MAIFNFALVEIRQEPIAGAVKIIYHSGIILYLTTHWQPETK